MAGHDVRFEGDRVFVGGDSWRAPYPISDLRLVGAIIALIYDYMSGPRHHQFQNLEGFDLDGHKLWTAQHPSNETADAYVKFVDGEGLIAWNFASYECTIDPTTGRLISRVFSK
jgi:hypothetical protein